MFIFWVNCPFKIRMRDCTAQLVLFYCAKADSQTPCPEFSLCVSKATELPNVT